MSLVKFICKKQEKLAKIRGPRCIGVKHLQNNYKRHYGTSSIKCPGNLKKAIAATNGFISPLEGLICQPYWDDVKEMNHKKIEELFLPKLEVSQFPAIQMLPLMPYLGHYKLFSLAAGQNAPNYSDKDISIDCFSCLTMKNQMQMQNAEDLIENTQKQKE